jgi:putative salt-induced outer membrane protein YdiY
MRHIVQPYRLIVRTVSSVLLMAALALPARAQGGASQVDTRILERSLFTAMLGRDAAALNQLVAPDFTLRGSPDVDRAAWLRNALTLCWGDRFDLDDVHTRRYENTIVGSFILTLYMNPETCRPAVLRSLVTDVWVRAEDDWLLTSRHSGPVPAADAGVIAQYGIVPEAPPRWSLDGELSLVATAGTSSTRTIGLGFDVQHRSDRTTSRSTLNYITTEAGDVTQAEALSAQARHGVKFGPHVQLFARGAYSRDRFAGINNRATADFGAGYTAKLTPRQSLTAEGGAGFVAEERLDATTLQFASANGTVAYAWKISRASELHEDATLTADLQRGRNWRSTSATSILVALNSMLSLKASHALEYRNAPVAGFGRTDSRTAAAVVITLRRK